MRQYEGMSDVSSHSRLIYLPAQLFLIIKVFLLILLNINTLM